MPDLPMQVIAQTTEGELTCFNQRNDDRAHAFLSWLINIAQSNNSYIHVEERDPAGHIVTVWRVVPAAGMKLSTAALAVAGTDLLVLGTGHHISSEQGRVNMPMVAVIPGVFTPFQPATPGDSPFQEAVLLGGAPDPTPGEPVDYTRIQTGTHAEIAAFAGLFGGGSVRGGLQEKAMDAAVALFTAPDSDGRAAAYRAHLAQFVRDRAYEALVAYFGPSPAGAATPTDGAAPPVEPTP